MVVGAVALLSLNVQPVMAQGRGRDAALSACAAERAPLVKLDKEYDDLKRSKMSAAIGEGLKTGAIVLAKGVASGRIGRGGGLGGFGGGFGGGLGGVGGLVGAVGGLAAQSALQQEAGGAAPSASAMLFGPDILEGAMGLNVPGISGMGIGGDTEAYAALAVLVAIVATADAYAKLKEQEAAGDLRKASYSIDQDAGRQLAVSRQIVDSGNALVECRARQLEDINARLASASNDKDRRAIRRERTELASALRQDIDVTGGVVEQHTGMAKTFTQGRAMTDGTSEAAVLGDQAPAYAEAAAVTRLSMPTSTGGEQAAAPAPAAAPPPALVTVRAAALRSAPVASAAAVRNLPAGTQVQAMIAKSEGGWWEVEVGGATGYVRSGDVGPPGSAPAGKGKAAAPSAAPSVAGPTNIRAYNRTVIAARDDGQGRLSSLMTDIQAAQRRESVLYAMLERFGWA